MPKFANNSTPVFLPAFFCLSLFASTVLGAGIVVLEDEPEIAEDIEEAFEHEIEWTLGTSLEDSTGGRDRRPERSKIRILVDSDDEAAERRFEFRGDWDSDSDSEDIVRFGESIRVEEGEIIEGSVVAIGGDIRVDGTIEEDVVVLGGTIHLGPTAVVEGDVVQFGGRLIEEEGSEVYGEDVGLSFTPAGWFGATEGFGGAAIRASVLGSCFLFLLVAGLAFKFVFSERLNRVVGVFRGRVWASFFVGLGVHILFPPLVLLLTIIVIGIPIAIVLPFVLLLATIGGTVVAAAVIGARLQGVDLNAGGGWFRSLVLGLFLLLGWILLGDFLASNEGLQGSIGQGLLVFGLGMNWILTTIGLGAVALSRFGRRVSGDGHIPPVPPVPPAPQDPPFEDRFGQRELSEPSSL